MTIISYDDLIICDMRMSFTYRFHISYPILSITLWGGLATKIRRGGAGQKKMWTISSTAQNQNIFF